MRFIYWIKHHWNKIFAASWRLALYETFNFIFDYPVYGWVMFKLGLVHGWLVMFSFSLVQNILTFIYHEKSKVDWLFAKTARDWENNTTEKSSWFRKITTKITRTRDKGFAGFLTFIFVSLHLDPTIVAAHYRKDHFHGISRRDWLLLFGSVLIGNLWWGIQIGLLVEILKWITHVI